MTVPNPRVLVVEVHDDFCPGLLAPWAQGRGIGLDVVRAHRGEALPEVTATAAAVVPSSHRSLREEGPEPAGLAALRPWVAEAFARHVPLLGIGFGAQLVASILGGDIGRATVQALGLASLVTEAAWLAPGPWVAWQRDFVVLPAEVPVLGFNGHGVQAFATDPHVGVLFHPEARPEDVERWSAGAPEVVAAARAPAFAGFRASAQARRAAVGVLFDGWAAAARVAGARPLRHGPDGGVSPAVLRYGAPGWRPTTQRSPTARRCSSDRSSRTIAGCCSTRSSG